MIALLDIRTETTSYRGGNAYTHITLGSTRIATIEHDTWNVEDAAKEAEELLAETLGNMLRQMAPLGVVFSAKDDA